MEKLSQKTISIKIKQKNNMVDDIKEIETYVTTFYESLLPVKEPIYELKIYPIIMPHYRSLPLFSFHDVKLEHPNLEIKYQMSRFDDLPSWFTTIETLDVSGAINCWNLKCKPIDLNQLFSLLKEIFSNTMFEVQTSEWMAFIVSPIVLRDKFSTEWRKELTDWFSFFINNGGSNNDYDHAFKIGGNFLRPIGRRARSWAVTSHVDPELDISMEFFSSIGVSKTYAMEVDMHKKIIQSKIVPWICPKEKIDELTTILNQNELLFQTIEEEDTNLKGIITDAFFDPNIRIFSAAKSWVEYDQGIVQHKLGKSFEKKLPGYEGERGITYKILEMYGDFNPIPKSLLITEDQITPGLPLNHKKRLIKVTRHRIIKNCDKTNISRIMENCANEIRKNTLYTNVDYVVDLWDYTPENKLLSFSIQWQPDITENSFHSYSKVSEIILKHFNMVTKPESTSTDKDTYYVLRYIAELFFSGDDAERLSNYYRPKR